ncbi:EAL domain-containing protein [Nitrosomonas cryotolerans]|uniref:EAL domain-containing protein n=1 Tax=Nitrosomonas cryotolerans TaxID=44575 RepID=UPI001160B8A5
MARAIVSMARNFGLRIVAKGVENVEQSHFLMTESCNLLQDYFYSRPIPSTAFQPWLQANQRAHPRIEDGNRTLSNERHHPRRQLRQFIIETRGF